MMQNPALIIGLGGTGQWVLTHLKKDLLEQNKGDLLANVQLLAFDTAQHLSAEARPDITPDEQQKTHASAIQLDSETEFIHIGSDLSRLWSRSPKRSGSG